MEYEIPTHSVDGIKFRLYNRENILALSVKEITNPQTFDTLSHPNIGGLYDPALGPTDRDDVCATCGQNFVHCPGHMGHIQLPLPAFNPVYFKTMYQILKGSCFACHRLAIQSLVSFIFTKKMLLLEHGLLAAVTEMQEVISGLLEEAESKVEVEGTIREKVTMLVEEAISGCESQKACTKNIEAVKCATQRDFLSNYFVVRGKCPHCKSKRASVRQEHQSRMLVTGNITPSNVVEEETGQTEEESSNVEGLTQIEEDPDSIAHNDADLEEEEQNTTTETAIMKHAEMLKKSLKSVNSMTTVVTVSEARNHLRLLWRSDGAVLRALFKSLSDSSIEFPTDIFFLDVIPVPPTRFRPVSMMNGNKYENSQTANLARILVSANVIRQLLQYRKDSDKGNTELAPSAVSEVPGKSWIEKFQNAWMRLQTHVNCVVDSELDKLSKDKNPGIKQLLEKKAGLFRKNMMGKRVNYAARSVISPDPCINTCEIGIPEVFAKKLTYPQCVTPWNIQELRKAVSNGPNVHPGASHVVYEDGKVVMLSHKDKTQREAIAKKLLTPSTNKYTVMDCKKVFRHLKNGDVLLLNRQPTLHRPSIQAHKARVLPGEKTLRLHYANCKAYNADFDGDEMNAHFPQNELARAEAYNIALTDNQYLVPKDGTPLAGLIQDHMVSGVWLTTRGRFFSRMDYCQLVYTALVDKKGPAKLLPPAMMKPHIMWSGKQVLSTILLNVIPEDKKPINLIGKSKIPEKSWIGKEPPRKSVWGLDEMGESHVVIRGGELLCGVLDKGHYGNTPYGLVHCVYELYGGDIAGKLLTCLGRLFMNFLQQLRSFTLGVEDILVTPVADDNRQGAITESLYCGPDAAIKALNLNASDGDDVIEKALKAAHFDKDDRFLRELDLSMKSKTDDIQNQIVRACMPKGLYQLFPKNNLQLMVQSGAKGSSVNCMQISGLLGQIELEGRRPPLMLSGKTLPSFREYDTSPRAGGFVAGRFLTGIRPQEYFFHCMAGREGLIDTAVKTSRSGYLQRCLVKHLEGVMVNYDMTVRDTDGSVVQFFYGEDGIDISKAGFLNTKQIPFLLENKSSNDVNHRGLSKKVAKICKKVEKWKKKRTDDEEYCRQSGFLLFCQKLKQNMTKDITMKNGRTKGDLKYIKKWNAFSKDDQQVFKDEADCTCPDPVMSVYRPYQHRGVLPEKFISTIKRYTNTELPKLKLPIGDSEEVEALMFTKCEKSLVDPGEAVGMLCAQSIGEPSTQMTLNTFHFAGRGEMNVTLGIPRLREILMVASANIKTPALDIPVHNTSHCREQAKVLQSKLNKVMLSEVIEEIKVCEYLSVFRGSIRQRNRVFEIHFDFLPHDTYNGKYNISPESVLKYMEKTFIKSLVNAIKTRITQLKKMRMLTTGTIRSHFRAQTEETHVNMPQNDEAENDVSDQEAGDGDAATEKERQRMDEEKEYEEEGEENPQEVIDGEVADDDVAMEEDDIGEEDAMDTGVETTDSQGDRESQSTRIHNVVNSSIHVASYSYDAKNQQWCKVTLKFGIMDSKFDITSLVEKSVREAVLYQVPGINRCLLGEEKGILHLKTEGINIMEMYNYSEILDLSKLYSNDIHRVASHYGIEAASKVIIKEVQNVFAAYGIQVDYRHLSLLADYMTFEGTYKPFNRIALETSTSPLQKMTFETTMHFLVNASIQGTVDSLNSPSSQLVTGRVVSCGSGTMDILQPLVL